MRARLHPTGAPSLAAAALAAAMMAAVAPSAAIADGPGSPPPAGACSNPGVTSHFHEELPATEPILPAEQLPADAVTVPTWSGSFTTDGTTYPYTMVGTNPAAGSATTHVPVEIIPLRLDFAGSGCVLDHDGMAADLEASPLFSPTVGLTGETQYVDDYQRANFWSTVGTVSPDYHLLLDPSDIPAVTLHVPAAQGLTAFDPFTDRPQGIVSGAWIVNQLDSLLSSLDISATTLAVFVPYNTFITDQNPNDCLGPRGCAYYIGFHSAILSNHHPHSVNTFAMASYIDAGLEAPPTLDYGADVLSHELLEWAADPFAYGTRIEGQPAFLANLAPAWSSPYFGNNSFCTTVLEIADPLEGGAHLVASPTGSSTNYVLANAAFLSWFARESPSTAIYGLYDLGGIFNTYSTAC